VSVENAARGMPRRELTHRFGLNATGVRHASNPNIRKLVPPLERSKRTPAARLERAAGAERAGDVARGGS